MCQIQEGYFKVNGNASICNAGANDTINVECRVQIGLSERQQLYKAELKILLPNNSYFSFFTPLKQVIGLVEYFTSESFKVPVPSGSYSISWIVIYDSSGRTICSSNGLGGTNCKKVTVGGGGGGCVQQDYTISLSKTSIGIGSSVTASVKMSGYPGRTWKLINTNVPSGQSQQVLGQGVLDSNSCGNITVPFSAKGTYKLVGRVCEFWLPSGAGAHCSVYDTDTNNSVTLIVSEAPPPGGGAGCNCQVNELCVLGQCVQKPIIFAAGALIFLLLAMRE